VPKIVPASARPTEPPTWRKNVSALVAAPSIRGATALCTTIVNTANDGPMPRPATNIQIHSVVTSVFPRSPVMRNSPSAPSASAPTVIHL
jgi:hypothetical protein